jgi:hypothetical protein
MTLNLEEIREMDLTDRQRINKVFNFLRRKGVTARANFMCCGGCAHYAMAEELGVKPGDPYVFYHKQDASSFGKHGFLERTIYLGHGGGDGALIAAGAFAAAGFEIDWNGLDSMCIGLKPADNFTKE